MMRFANCILPSLALALVAGCGEEATPTTMASSLSLDSSASNVDADGYAITPLGRFHFSCIHRVPAGAEIARDRSITDRAGNILERVQPCAFPPRDKVNPRAPARKEMGGGQAPTVNGWVESRDAVAITATSGAQYFDGAYAEFIVPPAPTSVSGQLVYFFPSLEPQSGDAIIQPVLQWGPGYAGGGNYWSYASWYIDHSNNIYISSLLTSVSAGDHIRGAMMGSNFTNGIGYWVIQTSNLSLPNSPTSELRGWTLEKFDWVQIAVLEAYNVATCSQYPNATSLSFTSAYVYEPGSYFGYYYDQDVTASLTWMSSYTGAGVTPSCSYSQSGAASNVATLGF